MNLLRCTILNKFVNKMNPLDENVYEAIWYELGFIPNRFHREFLQDVIYNINEQDTRSVHKNGNFYLDAIWEDMTEEELNGNFWCDIGCIGKMSDFYDENYINLRDYIKL